MREVERIIITGATGHLGSHLLRELYKSGRKKLILLILPQEAHRISEIKTLYPDIHCVIGDLCNQESLENLFRGMKNFSVIHGASLVDIGDERENMLYRINVEGTRKLLELAKRYSARRFLYISSVHAIPSKPNALIHEVHSFSPESVEGAYAKTKAIASQLVQDAHREGMDTVIVHPSGIVGPEDPCRGHMTELIEGILSRKISAIVEGGYDFVDVRDVAKGVVSALDYGLSGETYLLARKRVSIRDMVKMIEETTKKKYHLTVIPKWFILAVLPLVNLYYKWTKRKPLFTKYSLHTLWDGVRYSHEKATRELSFKTRNFSETVFDTVQYLLYKKVKE